LPVQGKSAITNFLVAREKKKIEEGPTGGDGEGGGVSDTKRPLEPGRDVPGLKEAEDGLLQRSKMAKIEEEEEKEKEEEKSGGGVEKNSVAAAASVAEKEVEELVLPEELSGVDIAEQRRLLKEATMLKVLADGKIQRGNSGGGSGGSGGGKGGSKGGGAAKGGQGNISRFFIRKS
jgi:hypothetical protein